MPVGDTPGYRRLMNYYRFLGLLKLAAKTDEASKFAERFASPTRAGANARRALLGFQELHARGGEGHDGFEEDRSARGVIREIQREGRVFHLHAIVEDANPDP
jgi:hypothetical protein